MKISKLIIIAILLTISMAQFTNPGCANFDSNNICQSCLNNYYLLSGICFPVSPLCLTYNPTNGNCLSCYNGFILSGTTCAIAPQIANCLNYSSSYTCIGCNAGFYLNNNQCTKVNPLCATYNLSNGQCLTCPSGYSLSLGQCVANSISNCITQSLTTCIACNQNYLLINNTCILKDLNCMNYQLTVCTNCSNGYFLVNNKCVILIQNCLAYDSSGNCNSCQNGYIFLNNSCVL